MSILVQSLKSLSVLLLGLLFAAMAVPPAVAQDLPFMEYSRVDPNKVVTDEACGECHLYEHQVWEKSKHATSFKTLHRKEQAETIAQKMGFRLIKRDSLCFSCHYTPVVQSGKIKVVSGPSCESCHGAGADWINIHNTYGEGKTFQTETAEHRRNRIEKSRKAGMRRPSDLYPVAANCFSCHTVPIEKLVNVGGHSTGSGGFELVERSQSAIRHNFLASTRAGASAANAERPMSRKRVMYVVGRALDLEYSLRGIAVAKEDGIYSKAMIRRVRSALAEVRAIDRNAEIPEISDMVSAVRGVQVVPRNEALLLAAADKVGVATRRFVARGARGDAMASLDPLVLGLGEPEEDLAVVDSGSGTPGAVAGSPAASSATVSTGPARAVGSSAVGNAAGTSPSARATPTGYGRPATTNPPSGAVGEFRRSVRPASKHRTVGPGACSGCHAPQNQWWFGHDHYRSADPFFDAAQKNSQIARLYGLSPSQMTRGNQICMNCHGTAVSGKESREVLDGVGCESCHGAAADWLEPHKDETDKHLGRGRPGHRRALTLGKVDLADLRQRAQRCTGCHFITESRLLSAGHPSGVDFDYAKGMGSVKHWDHGGPAAAELNRVVASVLAERGPVPEVQRAVVARGGSAPVTASGSASPIAVVGGGLTESPEPQRARGTQLSSIAYATPPPPRPIAVADLGSQGAGDEAAGGALPPFPQISQDASLVDVMRLLQDRLQLLYRLVAPAGRSAGQ